MCIILTERRKRGRRTSLSLSLSSAGEIATRRFFACSCSSRLVCILTFLPRRVSCRVLSSRSRFRSRFPSTRPVFESGSERHGDNGNLFLLPRRHSIARRPFLTASLLSNLSENVKWILGEEEPTRGEASRKNSAPGATVVPRCRTPIDSRPPSTLVIAVAGDRPRFLSLIAPTCRDPRRRRRSSPTSITSGCTRRRVAS